MAKKPKLREIPVGAGDLYVSNDPETVLAVHGLGSCVGVAMADPYSGVAGLAHVFLPDSQALTDRQRRSRWNCADDAIPELLRQLRRHGARDARLAVVLAGGSSNRGDLDTAGIGKANQQACRRVIAELGLRIQASYLGGPSWRTVKVFVQTGEIAVITNERIDLVDHPDRPGLASAAMARTQLESVDDVVDCLSDLTASAAPPSSAERAKRTPVPQNIEEISQLLNHLLQDNPPEKVVHRAPPPSEPPRRAATAPDSSLADLLGPLIDAKNRQQDS